MYFNSKSFIGILLLALLISGNSFCQIKVFERPPEKFIPNSGINLESPKRTLINLNGTWQVSFDDGSNFSNLKIPLSYHYEGKVIFKKSFSINDELLRNSTFILVCEAINYEAAIRINNNFITNHYGGNNSLYLPIEENVLGKENIIEITVNNKLNNSETIPLANQINYSCNFGGIHGDIYLLAVPKVYVFNCLINYTFESENSVKISNSCTIRSSNIDQTANLKKDFTISTIVIKKSTGEELLSSEKTKFQIENFAQVTAENKLILKNISSWSPENPELYLLRISISYSDSIVDEYNLECGFTNIKFSSNNYFLNGKPYMIKGINYHQESPKYGTALDYREVEKDLLYIKSVGFNCIRIPGNSASPYVINTCNRLGLFLFQDYPFNEVPQKTLSKNKYIESSLEYLENIIKRDKNAACILAWGLGNNFDVTVKESKEYLLSSKEAVRKYDSRPVYYTTCNISNDICQDIVDFKGLNFFTNDINDVKNKLTLLNKNGIKSFFISSFGVSINNENRNGFSDIYSMEYQTKFLIDCFKLFTKENKYCFISSYSDWNSARPLIFSLDKNPYLKTDGIFSIDREPKQSVNFLKHLLNNQELPRLMEGSSDNDNSYIFVVSGIILIIILTSLIGKLRKFKENIFKFSFKPKVFFELVKEQSQIPLYYNILLSIFINAGLAIYLSAIFYYFRTYNSFDVIISKIITNDTLKILLSEYISSPLKLIIFLFFILFFFQILISLFIFFLSLFTKGRSYFKNIYSVNIWSSLPFLIFLPIGTVIYKLSLSDSGFISLSYYIYIILSLIFLYRIISGSRILLEINRFKMIFFSLISLSFFYGSILLILYYKGCFEILNLLKSYN